MNYQNSFKIFKTSSEQRYNKKFKVLLNHQGMDHDSFLSSQEKMKILPIHFGKHNTMLKTNKNKIKSILAYTYRSKNPI